MKKVYVIDDDVLVLDVICAKLANEGFDPSGYNDPVKFLEAAPTLPRGCIVLDFEMPGMNGLEVQEALRKMDLGFQVIFYSGRGSTRTAVEGMRAGAGDFLQKGGSIHPLVMALRDGFKKLALTSPAFNSAEE